MVESVYDYIIGAMNRAIPVAIAVYRYLHVFKGTYFMVQANKKFVQKVLLGYIFGKKDVFNIDTTTYF